MESSENLSHNVKDVADISSRTLFIAEVFRHVCLFTDKSTLARLARCCKSFRELALRTLWEDLTILWPLMECFPDDVLEVDERDTYVSISMSSCPSQRWIDPKPFMIALSSDPQVKRLACIPCICVVYSPLRRPKASCVIAIRSTRSI